MMRKFPAPQNPARQRLWSPAEIADYYGYEVATIAGWRKAGLIPCVELITGDYRYDMGKVREIMEVKNDS
jgi:predicted site-specific integrase-resolvase